MIKMTVAVKRRPDLSRQDFARHYRDRHGPLVRTVHAYRAHCLKYIQNQALYNTAFPVAEGDEWDAVTELWYEDLREFEAASTAPEYMAQIRPDEIRFVDMNQLIIGIADERVLREGRGAFAAASAKLIVFRQRHPDIPKSRFDEVWRTSYCEAIADSPAFRTSVRRYVQSTLSAAPDASGMPGVGNYDATDEFWFDSEQDARSFAKQLHTLAPPPLQSIYNQLADVKIIAREHTVFE
jgi:uncharacterized protein (TIGR02118 family)